MLIKATKTKADYGYRYNIDSVCGQYDVEIVFHMHDAYEERGLLDSVILDRYFTAVRKESTLEVEE